MLKLELTLCQVIQAHADSFEVQLGLFIRVLDLEHLLFEVRHGVLLLDLEVAHQFLKKVRICRLLWSL